MIRSVIFFHDEEQKALAEQGTKAANPHYGGKISTTIEPIGKYFAGEVYHQGIFWLVHLIADYLVKNPHGYECATHFERFIFTCNRV
jgi:peptide-methionine (S)-S-oxide reductase